MDFMPSMVGEDGVIRGPAGDGRVAAILRDDVAAAAVAVLTSGGHDGHTYDLTGPEAFSFAEAAALLTRVTGKPIRFEDETEEQAYASRARARRAGLGDPRLGELLPRDPRRQPRRGHPAVRDLTGRAPTSLAAHLRASPAS